MRAKEDVLNRLGGQLTKTSGLVRIGYGKGALTSRLTMRFTDVRFRSRVDSRSDRARPRPPSLDCRSRPRLCRRDEPADSADEGALDRFDPADDHTQPPARRLLVVRSHREREGPHAQILRGASAFSFPD